MAGSGDQRAETPPLLDHNGNPITANFEANEFKLTDAPVTYDEVQWRAGWQPRAVAYID